MRDILSYAFMGGPAACPAACEAPAGSQSDKKLRHVASIAKAIRSVHSHWHRGRQSGKDCTRRGLLSLRDPTALTGRSGHPFCASASMVFVIMLAACFAPTWAHGGEKPAPASQRRLVMAFASHRERPAFANLYLYRHDAVGKGELAGSIPTLFERADSHPSLTSDGARCAYASKQIGGFTPLVNFCSLSTLSTNESSSGFAPVTVPASFAVPLPGPAFNSDAGSRIEPCQSGDGKLLALCARGQAGSMGGWDVQLFDTASGIFINLPGLNSDHDEREVTLSRDGRLLAFVTNRVGGAGLSDIGLYDRETAALMRLDDLNSEHREINPALSADGRFLAFVSDRPGGAGGKDIYLYDHVARRLIDLPGLNSVAHEQTPALSPDGRFMAFVSERTAGAGERDIYLYDRQTSRLVPTPGLNSKQEDFDPCLAYEDIP